jgi:methyl-accepting chemotaxis protein
MLVIFIFIGMSFTASLLCIFLPPIVPGIASMTASLAAILTFALFRMGKKVPDSKVVRVDGVTLDSRGEIIDHTQIANEFTERLDMEIKGSAALRAELDLASGQVEGLESAAAGVNSRIEEITSSFKEVDSGPTLREAISNLDIAMRHVAGLRESVARQSEELSVTCDTLKKRRTGDSGIDTAAEPGQDKTLAVMASTLEELCEHSNVIAVNGAIEAARIGKAGKGFSVIAGEMQNFAVQAKNLADEFRTFGTSYAERRRIDEDKVAALKERERAFQETADKAAAITVGLAEDVNRLIATGVSRELDELSKSVETEIRGRQNVRDQLSLLLDSTQKVIPG